MKYPIILPKQSHISSLLIRHIHERYGHCGRNYVLSQLRKKYWITSGNSAARSVISKCVICRRLKNRPGEQKMANLPYERILPVLNIWGLIYKTVRGIATKSVRTPKSQVLRAPKNIQIYKTLRTHTVRNLFFINHRLPTSVRS